MSIIPVPYQAAFVFASHHGVRVERIVNCASVADLDFLMDALTKSPVGPTLDLLGGIMNRSIRLLPPHDQPTTEEWETACAHVTHGVQRWFPMAERSFIYTTTNDCMHPLCASS